MAEDPIVNQNRTPQEPDPATGIIPQHTGELTPIPKEAPKHDAPTEPKWKNEEKK